MDGRGERGPATAAEGVGAAKGKKAKVVSAGPPMTAAQAEEAAQAEGLRWCAQRHVRAIRV